jgi:hypothetical protein
MDLHVAIEMARGDPTITSLTFEGFNVLQKATKYRLMVDFARPSHVGIGTNPHN